MGIQVLDADVAAKIAAGEVIERPASVVKELVENAIDAGATEIRIEIRNGGQREIRIVDNGCGIPADEVELAFQRHATSKLRDADDLFDVHTLGFRGEALPSIATIAQVTCISRTADAPSGLELRIAGGEIQGSAPRGGSAGTTFVIKNLFYNTPARLKFMRSEATEAAQISSVIEHYALAYPEIRWVLLVDGRLSLQTPGSGSLLDAIMELYGIDVARQLIAVDDGAGEGIAQTRVAGFVSQPSLTRSARSSIHLFVNRRWVRASGPLVFVIEEAYHNLLMKGRHPLAILNIEVHPSAVDVNVHPTKAEVKFLHQPQVLALLGRAVRAALAEQVGIGDLTLPGARPNETLQRRIELRQLGQRSASNTRWSQPPLPPAGEPGNLEPPPADEWPRWEPPAPPPSAPAGDEQSGWPDTSAGLTAPSEAPEPATASPYEAQDAIEAPAAAGEPYGPSAPPVSIAGDAAPLPRGRPAPEAMEARLPPLRVVGQVGTTYIVAEAPDGMYLVDQHAAHERVIFERLLRDVGTQPIQQQHMLLPATVDLPPATAMLLLGHAELLAEWGFAVEDFGDGTLRVRSVPHGLNEGQIQAALFELADRIGELSGTTPEDWRERVLTTIACHSAVRAGQPLAHEEMRRLIQQLEGCTFPRSCPHGRPTTLLLSQAMLDRQFGRKG